MFTGMQASSGQRATRKPRIMIAGEFSAGKSRLINGLVGQKVLPSQVTSTSLPPIWLVHGGEAGITVGLDGRVKPLDFEDLDVEDTLYCVLPVQAPILRRVDLIDTPGNSDPNIPAICWERMVSFADGLIWCTSAMQAWRQSEKAACAELPEDLLTWATLLVTHADRLPDDASVQKVLGRVQRDSSDLFSDQRAISLIRAPEVAALADDICATAVEITLRGQEETNTDALRSDDIDVAPVVSLSSVEPPKADPVHQQRAEVFRLAARQSESDRDGGFDLLECLDIAKPAPADVKPERREGSRSCQAAPKGRKSGPAALLWRHMTRGLDLSDPGTLRESVDAFIERLDSYSGNHQQAVSGRVLASTSSQGN